MKPDNDEIIFDGAILGGGAEGDGDSWDRHPRMRKWDTWTCKRCGDPTNPEFEDECGTCFADRAQHFINLFKTIPNRREGII